MTTPDTQDRFEDIMRLLIARTAEREVRWRSTDAENVFALGAPSYGVIIEKSLDRDGDENVTMKVLNAKGLEVGQLSSTWLPDVSDPWENRSYRAGPLNSELLRLYELARRSALSVDDVLESIFNDLRRPAD